MVKEIAQMSANGRKYKTSAYPVVAVCVEGYEPDCITQASQAGVAPDLKRMVKGGASPVGDCVVPAFSNPNNVSIVTCAPPSDHGICDNYFLDPSGLTVPLRSHGGISDQKLSLLFNCRLEDLSTGWGIRNFGVFDLALNCATFSATERLK
jgi:predicted AlkP superfamily pyrophosphatase or phosphodiesterase